MFDQHIKGPEFGILPEIFHISTYSIFVSLGIIAGIAYYLWDAQKRHAHSEGVIEIVAAGLIFGTIGAKIPVLIENPSFDNLLFAKSIVGGLIGGLIGVKITKKYLKISLKMGNIIAPSIALGMMFGRIGCFLNGCCFGKISTWGVDFGDGLLRYPTQLFEVGFHLIAFVILHQLKVKVKQPGILFNYYLLAYFSFRFMIEFIRENQFYYLGISIYQIISLLGILYLMINMINQRIQKKRGELIE